MASPSVTSPTGSDSTSQSKLSTSSPEPSQQQAAATTTSSSSQPSSSSSSSPPTNNPPNPYLENDPARTGFDPALSWWTNYARILTGRVTPEGVFHYRESLSRHHEERDVKRAEGYRDWVLAYSPTVRFLNERIAELNHGRGMDAANVLVARCPARLTPEGRVERMSGGFDPRYGVLVCSNAVRNKGHLEDTLAHEMVHAYDHLRWEVDFRGEKDLRQAACTEIRASMLSGECRFMREFWQRSNWRVTEEFQACVRRRAVLSLLARPWCKDDVHAVKTINEVWDSCFSDTRPFDEVYR